MNLPVTEVTASKKTIRCTNPATLETIGEVEVTPVEAIDKIFRKAREVQREWRKVPLAERLQRVASVTQFVAAQYDTITTLITKQVGKPLGEGFIAEVYGAMDSTFHYYSTASDVLEKKEEIPLGFYNSLDKQSFLCHKPVGIVAIIGPYNYPFIIPFEQIVQSLMAGNGIVFKPSSDTALIGKKIQELFDSTDIPRGLLTTVYGAGSIIGNAIVDRADMVLFTGSTDTGKSIMRRAAENLTPVVLELGGKDAMVVFPDANMERAALAARWGVFGNSGQVCASVKRLYVHTDIYDKFIARFVELTLQLRQGNPLDNDVDVGAMINKDQLKLVEDIVDLAKQEGIKVLAGGRRNPTLKGYFYEPTILGPVQNDSIYAQKEIFGPVVVVIPFKTEEEVIAMVNNNTYALTASVWTSDITRGERIAHEIVAGTVLVNEVVYTFALAATPWGGPKRSGLGRSHGKLGFLSVVRPLHLNIDTYKEPDAWWMPYDKTFREMVENFKEIANSLIVK